jgi:hypothetical protein
MSEENQEKNLFDELGLSVQFSEVSLGQVYPIYGMITKFISESPGNIVVMINDHIEATMNVVEEEKIDILKNRSFDPGIFVCTITQTTPSICAECSTVVFGKNNNAVQ